MRTCACVGVCIVSLLASCCGRAWLQSMLRKVLPAPLQQLAWDWAAFPTLVRILLFIEVVLGAAIILKVPYTEIDWIAYMQEVSGFLHGELDYVKLQGDTGPLVYPAGFVYVFSGLYYVTDEGRNLVLGQWIFLAFYVALMAVVLRLYGEARVGPPWTACLLVFTKRVHSIFMLRLFNDGVAILVLYCAIALFCKKRWYVGCAVYSFAVSIKMNIFLFAPALLVLLLRNLGLGRTVGALSICALVQLVLGAPFLWHAPISYLTKAFELSRVFMFKWTVNYKFLPPDVFTSPVLSISLLVATMLVWAVFAHRWVKTPVAPGGSDAPSNIVLWLFTSNFVGVVFSRTLHYQFYSWYFHTLPLLLWYTPLPVVVKCLLMAGIEVAFNVFPATEWSSALLQVCHLALLIGLLMAAQPIPGAHDVLMHLQRSDPRLARRLVMLSTSRIVSVYTDVKFVSADTRQVVVSVGAEQVRIPFNRSVTTVAQLEQQIVDMCGKGE